MQIRPILSALRRHRLVAGLLALLVAFTCAIVCNVAFMITQHATQMQVRSGLAEARLVTIRSFTMARGANPVTRHQTDLAALRAIPGVTRAVAVDALPFVSSDWSITVSAHADESQGVEISVFDGGPGEVGTLGLAMTAGRDFQPDEYVPKGSAHGSNGLKSVTAAIVTRALANRLFPGRAAVGQMLYTGDRGIRIVGVVARLLRPGEASGPDDNFSVLLPMVPDSTSIMYVLNTAPRDRARVTAQATDALNRLDHDRVLRSVPFTQVRADHFQRSRTMIWLLVAAVVGLLLVAAFGIAGLASFWVQQRTRTIGIRRAIGATRHDILRYFQTENFLIVTAGIVLGVVLALVLNLVLMHQYELPRLPLYYLAIGAAALLLLGQMAVLGPALRASRVPPVVATRSV